MKFLFIFAMSCVFVSATENIIPIEIDLNSVPKELSPKLLQLLEVNNKKYLNFSPALLSMDKSDDFREILMPKNLHEETDANNSSIEKQKQDLKIIKIYKVDEDSYLALFGVDSKPDISEPTTTSVWRRGKKSWYCYGTFVSLFQAIEKLNVERLTSSEK
jgi:hypothetical protein